MKVIIQSKREALRSRLGLLVEYYYPGCLSSTDIDIFVITDDISSISVPLTKDVDVILIDPEQPLTEIVSKILSSIQIKTETHTPALEAYLPIPIHTLKQFLSLAVDIYLKLSDFKFIRVRKKEDSLTEADLDRYLDKKVNVLYFSSRHLPEVLQALSHFEELNFWETVYQTHAPLIQQLGIQTETIRYTQDLIHETLGFVKKSTQWSEFTTKIEEMRKASEQCFLSSHSILTAIIATHWMKELQWSNPSNDLKIVTAAVIHDITLADPELSKLENIDEVYLSATGRGKKVELIQQAHQHVLKLANMIDSKSNDLRSILEFHYSKFRNPEPNKGTLTHSQLALLFHVCHELAHYAIKTPDFDLIQFLDSVPRGKVENQLLKRLAA